MKLDVQTKAITFGVAVSQDIIGSDLVKLQNGVLNLTVSSRDFPFLVPGEQALVSLTLTRIGLDPTDEVPPPASGLIIPRKDN